MRKIEFRGYVGDEELFVAVPLNEKKAKLSKKDILKVVSAFEVAADEKGINGEVEMFGVGRYAISDGYFWLGWGAYWEEIQKALHG